MIQRGADSAGTYFKTPNPREVQSGDIFPETGTQENVIAAKLAPMGRRINLLSFGSRQKDYPRTWIVRATKQGLDGTWKVSHIRKGPIDFWSGERTPSVVIKSLVQQVIAADNKISAPSIQNLL